MPEPGASTPATTSRAVLLESFGGPEVLNLREVPAPQAGPGQIRVRVTAAGLNPMDWFMTSGAETATRFGLSLPSGFGTDYAGVVDQVGDGVTEFAAGDRVFGGALSRAVADYVVIDVAGTIAAGGDAHHTPGGVDDRTAATLAIAGCTAAAALAVVNPGPGDTLLIGGAGGGVGVFTVQLARLAGARVIGTGSATSADALRALGAEPVAYGAAWPAGSVPWLPAASPRRSTCTGRTRCRRHENLACLTSASPPSLHRSTGSRRQTALMPPPAPSRRLLAWSRRASSVCPSRQPSRSSRSAPRSSSKPAGTCTARSSSTSSFRLPRVLSRPLKQGRTSLDTGRLPCSVGAVSAS